MERKDEPGIPAAVEFTSLGFRDVYWCPYLNEPVIITYPIDKERKAWCSGCNGSMSEDHSFICTILKPWSLKVLEKEKESGKESKD